MDKDKCCLFGTFVKVNGFKGELVLKSYYFLSEKLESIPSIFIEIDGILIPFFITNFIIRSSFAALIKLEDIDNTFAAKELIGKNIYTTKDNFHFTEDSFVQSSQLIGYTIVDDNDKEIGEIYDTINIRQNPIAMVRINNKETLIPINNKAIISIDDENKIIKLHIAEGLLEINL